MNTEPTVFVVDDEPAVRHSLERLLDSAHINCITYESGEGFLADYKPETPGCLLLDVRMPGMSGIELQRRLADAEVNLPVVIITGHADVPMAVAAMKTGAVDFIEKPFEDTALLRSVSNALESYRKSVNEREFRAECTRRVNLLSPREREVLSGLAAGQTVDQIASQLGISAKTVYMHRTHLMEKVAADSVADLVKLKMGAERDTPNNETTRE